MSPLRARVEKGRLVLDEPTTLPDGTVVDLVADGEGDDLTDEERRALHEALSASWRSAEAGRLRPASAILDELRRRRRVCRSEPLLKQTRRSARLTHLFLDELTTSFAAATHRRLADCIGRRRSRARVVSC